MKLLSLMIAALLIIGCTKDPQSVDSTSNPEVSVATLFTHDGCTVYRFYDSRYHYFAKCTNVDTTTAMNTHLESCGKNCWTTRDDEIPTIYTK